MTPTDAISHEESPATRRLLEVTLQHALQSLAVASLVTGHLVDGVLAAQACENVPFGPFSA